MQPDTPIFPTTKPHFVPLDEARETLKDLIDGFLNRASRWIPDEDLPAEAMALRVTAGTGKTGTALRLLSEHAKALLSRGSVLFYVPTLDLAERAAKDFQRIAPEVPYAVVRGRLAANPDTPSEAMCSRAELVEKLSGFVPSLTEALCQAERADGTWWQSPCRAGCPYFSQKESTQPKVYFLSHGYISSTPPIDLSAGVSLRVVDEKIWPSLAKTRTLSLDAFFRKPGSGFPETLLPGLQRTRAEVMAQLQNTSRSGGSDITAAEHITPQLLSNLIEEERNSRLIPDIRPWDETSHIQQAINDFDNRSFHASTGREMVLSLLSHEPFACQRRITLHSIKQNEEDRSFLKLHTLTQLKRDAPLLLLDADADPEITEQIAPGASFHSLDVQPNAEVLQLSDRTLSDSWLLDPVEGPQRRGVVLDLIEREVRRAESGGVLCVATRAVLSALMKDEGISSAALEGNRAGGISLRGATSRWFGPRMQGINDFEAYSSILIIGRIQPPPHVVQDVAHCIFGSDKTPFQNSTEGSLLVRTKGNRLSKDGVAADVSVQGFIDLRANLLLSQMRECASLQAIARLRLAASETCKRVVVLSNVPLPGLPVDRLVGFDDFYRGLENEPDPQGYHRLSQALRYNGVRHGFGIRLSATGLAADLSRSFTVNSAKTFRKGRSTEHLAAILQRIAQRNKWPITELELKPLTGGRKSTKAVIFSSPRSAHEHVQMKWVGFSPTILTTQSSQRAT